MAYRPQSATFRSSYVLDSHMALDQRPRTAVQITGLGQTGILRVRIDAALISGLR